MMPQKRHVRLLREFLGCDLSWLIKVCPLLSTIHPMYEGVLCLVRVSCEAFEALTLLASRLAKTAFEAGGVLASLRLKPEA